MQVRLTQLLGLLPARDRQAPGAFSAHCGADYGADHNIHHLDGQLCAALCLHLADDAVAVLDAHWGEDWAESLVEQELLDEFMALLEERWHALTYALDLDILTKDPDTLHLGEALPWASSPTSTQSMPAAARAWAYGFKDQAGAWAGTDEEADLLDVIHALTLQEGDALVTYLERAYDRPAEVGASALVDDALFAAQDLRRATA